jgi:hypothetical protein
MVTNIYNNVTTAANSNSEAGPAIIVVGQATNMAGRKASGSIAGKKT